MSETERMVDVDAHPDAHRATERDEEAVLDGLYGPPGSDGIYRGFVGGELANEDGEPAE